MKRNIVQCLDDYGIPLKLSHTLVDIRGRRKLEGVVIAEVDGTGTPIPGTEEYYECDTLLLSCGLIPENELSLSAGITINGATSGPVVDEYLNTSIPGIFACGNVLHVHDLVDFVSEEAGRAGRNAAKYIADKGSRKNEPHIVKLIPGNGVRYTVPCTIDTANTEEDIHLRFRVRNVYKGCTIKVSANGNTIISKKKRITVPSEMEDIILKPDMLGGIDGDITVGIEEGGV